MSSRHEVASVGALAKALGRDYSNVYADVQALTAAGLLDAADGGVRANYDAIETKIAICEHGRSATERRARRAACPPQLRRMERRRRCFAARISAPADRIQPPSALPNPSPPATRHARPQELRRVALS
jgi:hypothetical protein